MLIRKLLVSCALLATQSLSAQTTIITNVQGYTLNSDRELISFTGLQFTGDTVDRLFTADDALPVDEEIVVLDGEGNSLLPGLIDAHGHVLNYGLSLLRVDMTATRTEQEAVQRVADFRAANPELDWIQGRGWNQVLWDTNAFPSAATLDAALDDTPMWFSRVDGHAGWANSAAMELAGINPATPDPDGGQIIRDAESRPTGVFIDNAMRLITAHIPSPTLEEQKYALRRSMHALARQGLTSVHDASASSTTVAAYKSLLAEGPLPVRVNVMLASGDPAIADRLAEGHFASDDMTLTINSVKIAADGALGSRGAALIEDYSDEPGNRGLLLHTPERLTQLMRTSMEAGFQVNVHAIGDQANMLVLDNFQNLITSTGSKHMRHRIEHAQVLRYEDILRFSELGVIASMQATHATSDKNMAQDRLGEARILGAYAWRKLLDAGAIIANGSDFPVESANPFFGLHAAITRQDHDNQPPGGWFPEESMTREEALASFTLDAAYSGHQEELLGSLEPGKRADFILVEQDIFSAAPTEIWKANVVQTWVNGLRVQE